MAYFTVKLFTPLPERKPLADFVVADRRAILSWETQYPGGYTTLTLELPPDAEAPTPPVVPVRAGELGIFSHVELYAYGAPRPVWEGQIVILSRSVSTSYSGQGAAVDAQQRINHLDVQGFTAHGYLTEAGADNGFTSTSGASYTPGTIVSNLTPILAPGTIAVGTGAQFVDPGAGNLRVLGDFSGKFLSEIIDELSKQGDGKGTPWDAAIWEGPTLWWLPRTPPSTPHYHVPPQFVSRWDEDGTKLRSGVTVSYTPSGGSQSTTPMLTANSEGPAAPISTSTFLATYKRARTAPLSGGTMTSGAATAWGLAYLTIHSAPEYAIELRVQLANQGDDLDLMPAMPLYGGNAMPLWTVRAGRWAMIADMGPLVITRTTFDAYQGSFSAVLGFGLVDQADQWRDVHTIARKLQRRLNPLSSAPWA